MTTTNTKKVAGVLDVKRVNQTTEGPKCWTPRKPPLSSKACSSMSLYVSVSLMEKESKQKKQQMEMCLF